MNAGILPQARDLVLQLQFTALQFQHLQVIRRRMRERFVDFVFQRPVPFRVPQDALELPCGFSPCVRLAA